jgi:hypothetical protein
MKQLLFLLLFVSAFSFGQIKINPIPVGYPAKQATELSVLVMPFSTDAKTCQLYYQLKNVVEATTDDAKKETVLADGNLSLTEAEFTAWGQSNKYLEDLALIKLQLTRKPE